MVILHRARWWILADQAR